MRKNKHGLNIYDSDQQIRRRRRMRADIKAGQNREVTQQMQLRSYGNVRVRFRQHQQKQQGEVST